MAIRPSILRLKPYVAWALAIFLLYWLFRHSPPALVWEAFKKSDWGVFLLLSIGYFVVSCGLDTLTLKKILDLHHCKIPLRDFFSLRGRSYYYSILNYNAGQGLLAYYLKKHGGTSWLVAGGVIFYVMLNDFFILLLAVCLSLKLSPIDSKLWGALETMSLLGIGVLLGLFLGLKWLPFWIKPLRSKLSARAWYTFMVHYPWTHLAKTFLYRALYVGFVIVSLYLPFYPFHIHVPFSYFLASTPITLMIGALPLTPSGLGTSQAAFLYFFSDHVHSPLLLPGEKADNLLLALILSWTFINLLLKFMVGFYFEIKKR